MSTECPRCDEPGGLHDARCPFYIDHSKDVPPHTHGGTDAPECTTCRPLLALAETWESMAGRPNGPYEQCARDLRQMTGRNHLPAPKWDITLSLLRIADSWDRRLWHEHGLDDPELQAKFTDWHSRQIRDLVRRFKEDKKL